MTTHDDLGRALAESLTYVGSQARPPHGLVERLTEGVGARPRRRGGVRWAPLAAVAAVLALLALTGIVVLRHDPGPVGEPATGAPPTYGSRSAASLSSARWTSLPDAPIEGRSSAVGVWTGSRMLVWGGATPSNGGRTFADGAAYDPASRRWSTLPAAPISGRTDAASVWTGKVLFVWGGYTSSSGSRASDGATYDPVTRTWHKLPPAPGTGYQQAVALTAGGSVLLLTTPLGNRTGEVNLQEYRPETDTWTRLPDLTLPYGHAALAVAAVSTGDRLLVWSMWANTFPVDANGTETTYGIDGYTYDVAQRGWAPTSSGGSDSVVQAPLWTGRDVLLPAAQRYCGGCAGPLSSNLTGRRLDPATAAVSTIPHGPVDDAGPTDLWTGAALLAVEADGSTGSPGPGAAAVWDPVTEGWTRLASAPLGRTDQGVVVWTGHSLLLWGTFSRGQGSTSRTGGLELG